LSPIGASVAKLNRNAAIAAGVALLHLALIWTLQAGLLQRNREVIVPVRVVADLVTPSLPPPEHPIAVAPPPRQEPVLRAQEPARPQPRGAAPSPEPLASRRVPAPDVPTGQKAPVGPALGTAPRTAQAAEPLVGPGAPAGSDAPAPPVAAVPLPTPGPAVAPTPQAPAGSPAAEVELPSSDAAYLRNPPPVYPAVSRRLGEQGKVIVRVLIGPDGLPQKAELKRSSGFERLDRSALDYVMRCRYVPGRIGGVPHAMWYEAPVSFVLE
jgi:periplasmic protein TonB